MELFKFNDNKGRAKFILTVMSVEILLGFITLYAGTTLRAICSIVALFLAVAAIILIVRFNVSSIHSKNKLNYTAQDYEEFKEKE